MSNVTVEEMVQILGVKDVDLMQMRKHLYTATQGIEQMKQRIAALEQALKQAGIEDPAKSVPTAVK